MNGRIIIKGGKRLECFLDPAKTDHAPDEIAAAKRYPRGAGRAFKALTPDEIKARTVKPASAAAPAATPAPAAAPAPADKKENK